MEEERKNYLPAAGRDWLLPFYDPFVKLLGGDSVRAELLSQASIRPHHRILDIGCGTGTLVIQVKRLHPEVAVVGLDPDPKALARGRRKARRAGVPIQFDQGFSDELPYPGASFDLVFSSFMFHHLRPDAKGKTMQEVRRVLKADGVFHLLDFVGQEAHPHGVHDLVARRVHGADRARHSHDSRILALMREAGFAGAQEVKRRATLLGRVAYYRASVRRAEGRGGG